MAKQRFEFVRLVGNERRVGPSLASVSRTWRQEAESFLFISPHDDDVMIGGGMMILSSLKAKVPVHVAIVTDGAMGYCTEKERETIAEIRRAETYEAYRTLGLPAKSVYWLGFPDCQLAQYQGRRPARPGEAGQVAGFTGLQNALTALLRKVRPNQVFLPTLTDIHPDHRIVHSETLISCFHASGAIWPELGEPISAPPYIHELAVYCNFPSPPKLRIQGPREALLKKLEAISKFKSQKQIKAVVEIVRRGGPMEYLRPVDFALYNSSVYRDMFDEPPVLSQMWR
jgi:LmbE family N-acetylglucosaminyl deacetylase